MRPEIKPYFSKCPQKHRDNSRNVFQGRTLPHKWQPVVGGVKCTSVSRCNQTPVTFAEKLQDLLQSKRMEFLTSQQSPALWHTHRVRAESMSRTSFAKCFLCFWMFGISTWEHREMLKLCQSRKHLSTVRRSTPAPVTDLTDYFHLNSRLIHIVPSPQRNHLSGPKSYTFLKNYFCLS